jgi:hypothetical protein
VWANRIQNILFHAKDNKFWEEFMRFKYEQRSRIVTRNMNVYKICLHSLDQIRLFKNRFENKIQVGVSLDSLILANTAVNSLQMFGINNHAT